MVSSIPETEMEIISPECPNADHIAEFVRDGIDLESPASEVRENPFWKSINPLATELWLDSGDFDSIDPLWCDAFSGLTTNNSLLNKVVQDGTYDQIIPKANGLLPELSPDARVREIAFILNVRHALELVQRFRCDISVELHTDVANDTEATVAYARRCHQICPEHFVVKIPLTPEGLIATRRLRAEDIRVNCTLGFSARQNYVATALSRPSFVNVFVGRLNAYVADNGLGDGVGVGEKATLASQSEVATFSRGLPTTDTRQIAASLRDAPQLPDLAGIDVVTMPTKVARQAEETLEQTWQSQLNNLSDIKLAENAPPETVRIEKLWDVTKTERTFVQKAILSPAENADELQQMANEYEVEDLFPQMSDEELQKIADDGKIPKHHRWQERIERGDLAIDSLMTFAGLASFAASQAELDQRIRERLG